MSASLLLPVLEMIHDETNAFEISTRQSNICSPWNSNLLFSNRNIVYLSCSIICEGQSANMWMCLFGRVMLVCRKNPTADCKQGVVERCCIVLKPLCLLRCLCERRWALDGNTRWFVCRTGLWELVGLVLQRENHFLPSICIRHARSAKRTDLCCRHTALKRQQSNTKCCPVSLQAEESDTKKSTRRVSRVSLRC